MKALTVKQPWAWAIIHGGKDIENRSRATKHRGNLYIHAGLGYAKEAEQSPAVQGSWINAAQNLPTERGAMGHLRKRDLFLDYGMILGTVDVVGCHHSVTSATRCCALCRNPLTSDCAHQACKCCDTKRCKCHNGPDAELLDYLTTKAES